MLERLSALAAILVTVGILSAPARAQAPQATALVELHSHLFMEEGMPLFFGDFFEPTSSHWWSLIGSQASPEALDRSGAKIVVAALYAYPRRPPHVPAWPYPSRRDAIRHQLVKAWGFAYSHHDWVIAHGAAEARAALAAGKKVLILSLEGADGILETDEDFREFVDEGGIRIVTPLHLTDDHFGGAAFLRGIGAILNPVERIEQNGEKNLNGLTKDGVELAHRLAAHHAWIDLSHASDQSQVLLASIAEQAGQPLLYTHTTLRKYYGSERGVTDAQLEEVKRSGGVVGVVPSGAMLVNTPVDFSHCPASCEAKCRRQPALLQLATQYSEMAADLGDPARVMFGSDFAGFVPHLPPTCGTGTSLDERGLTDIGQLGETWTAMKSAGAAEPADPDAMVKAFLAAWEKVAP